MLRCGLAMTEGYTVVLWTVAREMMANGRLWWYRQCEQARQMREDGTEL